MEKNSSLDMADIQKVSLEILKRISTICVENGFKYFLAYGTLIGAIRHKGYIPWDDDVDIMMPRPDYNRFIEYLKEHEEELGNLKCFTPKYNEDYPYMLTRISDDRYYIEVKNEKPYGMGIFIDVYPLDGLGNSYEEAYNKLRKTTKLCSMIFLSTRKSFHFDLTKGFIKKTLKLPAFCVAKLAGKRFWMNRLQNELDKNYYEDSSYVGAAAWCTYPYRNIYEKGWCNETEMASYEDTSFYIPKGYDKILKTTYGDYMKLPPEKDRIYHHLYKAFKKQ